jgi:hypothetical protein
MATAADIITAAFIKIGVEVPTTAQTASALISLNNMMSLLGADKFAPVVVSEGFSLEASDPEYTIGPGGQWDTVRPQGVISCFLRGSNGEDYPIKVMSGRTYNNMPNKYFPGQPTELYFLPEYPLAKIHPLTPTLNLKRVSLNLQPRQPRSPCPLNTRKHWFTIWLFLWVRIGTGL